MPMTIIEGDKRVGAEPAPMPLPVKRTKAKPAKKGK